MAARSISDPRSKKLADFFMKAIKKKFRGAKVDVVRLRDMPHAEHGWDSKMYAVLSVLLPKDPYGSFNMAIVLNEAKDEASGNVAVDYSRGGVIAMGRFRTADEVAHYMLSDALDHFRSYA